MGFQNLKAWDEGEATQTTGDMVFCSLHHHTTFSYQDGYGKPDHHHERAAELGMYALGATEHGNITSHVQHEQAAQKHGTKVVFGSEIYTGMVGEGATQRKNHLTVLAENQEGYQNLLRLVSRGWSEGYYYEPTVSGPMLAEHAPGLLVLSGCSGSLLATSLVGGKNVPEDEASYERALRIADRMHSHLGEGQYFLEVQAFPELEKTKRINQGLASIGEKLGIPLVATIDAHYMMPEEAELQAILHNVRPGKKKTIEQQAKQFSYDVPLCPLTDRDIFKRLVATGLTKRQAEMAIRMSRTIAERCDVTLPKVTNLKYPLPPDVNSNKMLFRRWLNDGWKFRGFSALPPAERQRYTDQVKYEMDLIQEKGFVDYFLFVSDAVRFCKDISYRPVEFQHYPAIPVGPARGSAAASLVCYLMRITEVNPMLFPTLLFERFIDKNRHDLPDIDLDFDDDLRYVVRDYLSWKYGADRVGNIATFTRYKGKNSLEDVQRALYRDNWKCKADVDTVKSLLIERASGDLRANATIEDTIEMFPQVKEVFERWPELLKATLLEGNVKGMSVHAAGLVVGNEPLTNACAVYTRADQDGRVKLDEFGNPMEVLSVDKYDAEYLNVLKLDALGLKTMGMIRVALELIDMKLEDLYALPLDDAETLKGFQDGDVVGVFQFDGRAMRSVNAGVIPDNFNEVCDINALARPGPLHSGATAEYIDVKHGRKVAVHYHPIVDEITKHTNYQIVYQEQILQVVRLLGGFSWEEAARIRKIISKKRGEQEFNTMRAKFVSGAAEHGMVASDADRVFSLLATAGAYAFNAAHCVSYGLLAYWTMWLKRHYPLEFFVASLRKMGQQKQKTGDLKRDHLLRDLTRHGRDINIGKLRLNVAERSWSIDPDTPNTIAPGFIEVHGIGDKTATSILMYREQVERFEEWDDLLAIHGIGPKTIDTIYNFWEDEDPFELYKLADTLNVVRKQLTAEQLHDGPWPLPATTHVAEDVPYDRTTDDVGVVWLGRVKERNLKDLFELHHSRTGEHLDPNTVRDPHLNEWVVMLCEDETDLLVVTVDRWKYTRMKETVWSIDLANDLILVRGIKRKRQARRAIYVTDLWVLDISPDEEEEEDDTE